MKILEPFQQRVVDEADELECKICKLDAFIGSETFDKLDKTNRALLKEQQHFMQHYLFCLQDRIELF